MILGLELRKADFVSSRQFLPERRRKGRDLDQIRHLLTVNGIVELPSTEARLMLSEGFLNVWKFKPYNALGHIGSIARVRAAGTAIR